MNKEITVTAFPQDDGVELRKNGLIRINANKPDFGSLMLRQDRRIISGTFLNATSVVCFITSTVEALEELVDDNGLVPGSNYNQKVADAPIKLIIKESVVPFYEGQTPKINPTTGEVLLLDSDPIYRQVFPEPLNSEQQDELVKHTQVGEVQEGFVAADAHAEAVVNAGERSLG